MASNSQPPKLYTALALKMYETAAISSLPDDSVIALESTFEPEKRDSNRCKSKRFLIYSPRNGLRF